MGGGYRSCPGAPIHNGPVPVSPLSDSARRQRPLALVVEDDERTAGWLKLYLERGGCDGLVCGDGTRATALVDAAAPDVVLLDLMLPGASGFRICEDIRAVSRVPIIVITARSAEDDRLRAFACGADDYVTKPFSPREVVARVKAVLRRTREPHDDRLAWCGWTLDVGAHEARAGGHVVALTSAETRLFAALLRAPQRVFTRRELVTRMFGDGYEGTERVVDVHVKNLRRKLAAAPAAPVIHTVHGAGYRIGPADAAT
jgi:DNA-binding response OmpR family regulator